MKNKGAINIEITFPIISFSQNSFSVVRTKDEFTVCNNRFLEEFKKKMEYFVLDSLGNLYSILKIERLGYTNILFGFNLSSGSSTYFAKIYLEKLKELSVEELKLLGADILKSKNVFFEGTAFDIKRWMEDFIRLDNRENLLRYIFFFADTSRYKTPDMKDENWRESIGFVN